MIRNNKMKCLYDNEDEYVFVKNILVDEVTSLIWSLLCLNKICKCVDSVKKMEARKETLERKGKLTDEKATKINQDIADANNSISKSLQKMTEEKRAKTIQMYKLSDTFNTDGTLKETTTYERGKYSTVGTEKADVKKIASDSGFTLAEELNTEQTNSWNKIREYTQKLKKKGLNIKGVAVVNETNNTSDFTVAGENKNGIILVNANRLSNLESALETLTHESTHSLPVTTETMKVIMASVLSEDAAIRESKSTKAVHEVLENYGYTLEEFQEAAEKFYQGADINDREANLLEEVTAVYSEQIGNEDSLNRITRADGNLILKAYYAIHDAVELHRISGDTAKTEYKKLRSYEKLYADALQSNGYDINVSDEDDDTQYSIKKFKNTETNRDFNVVVLETRELYGMDKRDKRRYIKQAIDMLADRGTTFNVLDGDNQQITIQIRKSNEWYLTTTGKYKSVNDDFKTRFEDNGIKQGTILQIYEITDASEFAQKEANNHSHDWLDNYGQNDWLKWNTIVQDKLGDFYNVTLQVAQTNAGDYVLYDIIPAKEKVDRSKIEPINQSGEERGNSALPSTQGYDTTSSTESQEESENAKHSIKKKSTTEQLKASRERNAELREKNAELKEKTAKAEERAAYAKDELSKIQNHMTTLASKAQGTAIKTDQATIQ